jgi:hypothetical protein
MPVAPHAPNAPQDKPKNRPHHKRFCSHRWVLSPTGGSDFSPAAAQRALTLIPGFFSPNLHSILFPSFPSRHSARQPTGVPQLALLLSLLNSTVDGGAEPNTRAKLPFSFLIRADIGPAGHPSAKERKLPDSRQKVGLVHPKRLYHAVKNSC